MKKISTIRLVNARNGEHFSFHEYILSVLTEAIATLLGFAPLRAAYAALFGKENEAYIISRALEDTKAVEAADKKRDDRFLYVKQSAETARLSPDAAEQAAGEALSFLFASYADAYKLGYTENTAQITNLIEDLRSEKYAAHVATLGLTAGVDALEESNEEFKLVFNARTGEKVDRKESVGMKQIRPEVDEAYRACVEVINALEVVNEVITKDPEQKAVLEPLIHDMNGYVLELQEIIARRTGKGNTYDGGSPDDEGTTPTPDEGEDTPDNGGDTPTPTPDPTPDPTPGGGDDYDDDGEIVG